MQRRIKCLRCGKKLIRKWQDRFCSVSCSSKYNNKGEKNGMFGRTGEESYWFGKTGPNYGKSSNKKNKTYEQIYGKEKAKLLRKKNSDAHKGEKNHNFGKRGKGTPMFNKHHTEETLMKISKALSGERHPMFNKHLSNETRRKIRIKTIKRIEENNGVCWPNYNKEACKFFKSFDEECGTEGKYAVYGGGEHYIEELGYWVDYFNPKLKLIMEYDEKHHFVDNGNLRKKDAIRQAEIQALYPDFKFIRIKQGEENILKGGMKDVQCGN